MQIESRSIECPFCCVSLNYPVVESQNTLGASFFSDGFAIGPGLPRISKLVQCPVCNEVFFYDATEARETASNDNAMNAAEPAMDRMLELLNGTRELTHDQELYLRKEIWYFGTHHPVGNDEMLNNPEFKMLWVDNLDALEALLDENNPDEVLIKAEANRHLGRFTRCLELIENPQATQCDIKFIKTMRKKANKGNTEVFET